MIEFSGDKKTSVLICGDKKGKAAQHRSAQLSSASPRFRQLACTHIVDRVISCGEKEFNGGGGCNCPCAKQMLSQRSCYLSQWRLAGNFEDLWKCLRRDEGGIAGICVCACV